MQSKPSEYSDPGSHWLLPRHPVSVETYCQDHGATHPEETTPSDVPSANAQSQQTLDEEAAEEGILVGKWLVYLPPDTVDDAWNDIYRHVRNGDIWTAKVSTKWSREEKGYDDHLIAVYVPNYFDTDDVFRVRDLLRDTLDLTDELDFKPDYYTKQGLTVPEAARFSE